MKKAGGRKSCWTVRLKTNFPPRGKQKEKTTKHACFDQKEFRITRGFKARNFRMEISIVLKTSTKIKIKNDVEIRPSFRFETSSVINTYLFSKMLNRKMKDVVDRWTVSVAGPFCTGRHNRLLRAATPAVPTSLCL